MPRQKKEIEEVKEGSICECGCHKEAFGKIGEFGSKPCCADMNGWIPENEYQRIRREDYKLKVKPIGDYSISWKELDGKGVACDRFQPGSDAEAMMWSLVLQDKIRTRVPREAKEPVDAVAQPVLNGLRINILKGVSVELPEQVADLIEESYYKTEKALEGNSQRLSGGFGSTRVDLQSQTDRDMLNA